MIASSSYDSITASGGRQITRLALLQCEHVFQHLSPSHYGFLSVEKIVFTFELNKPEPFEEVFEGTDGIAGCALLSCRTERAVLETAPEHRKGSRIFVCVETNSPVRIAKSQEKE